MEAMGFAMSAQPPEVLAHRFALFVGPLLAALAASVEADRAAGSSSAASAASIVTSLEHTASLTLATTPPPGMAHPIVAVLQEVSALVCALEVRAGPRDCVPWLGKRKTADSAYIENECHGFFVSAARGVVTASTSWFCQSCQCLHLRNHNDWRTDVG